MKIMVTGSEGFIAGYLVQNLLNEGHEVVGIDNFQNTVLLNVHTPIIQIIN